MSDLVTLSFEKEPDNTSVVVAVGEIDLSNCKQLDDALAQLDGAPRIAVDLRQCAFFDSSTLAVLVRHALRVRDEGHHFSVRVDPAGQRIIDITNLNEVLRVDDDQEVA